MYKDVHDIQMKAEEAFGHYRARQNITKAMVHRSRPHRGPWVPGDQCWYFRKTKPKRGMNIQQTHKAGGWRGKAVVVATQGAGSVWVQHAN